MTVILVALIFIFNIYSQMQKGERTAWIQTIGLVISYIVAMLLYRPLAQLTALWIPYPGLDIDTAFTYYPDTMRFNMDTVFFQAIAFVLLLLLGKLITEIICHMIGNQADSQYPSRQDQIVGGVTAFIRTWFWLFILFAFLSTLTFPVIQNYLSNNLIADLFIRFTPLFSQHVISLWVKGVAHL